MDEAPWFRWSFPWIIKPANDQGWTVLGVYLLSSGALIFGFMNSNSGWLELVSMGAFVAVNLVFYWTVFMHLD